MTSVRPSLIERLPRGRRRVLMLVVVLALAGAWGWARFAPPPPPAPTPRTVHAAPPPSIAATIEGFARALPADASLGWIARDGDGRLQAQVTTLDPDRLRAALRREGATAALRDAGQRRGEGGITVTFEEPQGTPVRTGALRDVAPLDALATRGGLLVERADAGGLAVSGDTAAVIAFIAAAEAQGVRFVRWRIERAGGATRLAGVPVAAPRAAPRLARAYARDLFADTAAADETAPDTPELAGVIGRIGRDAVALVRDGERTRTLAPGASVAGWRLESLSADAAYFTRGTQRARVALPTDDADQ